LRIIVLVCVEAVDTDNDSSNISFVRLVAGMAFLLHEALINFDDEVSDSYPTLLGKIADLGLLLQVWYIWRFDLLHECFLSILCTYTCIVRRFRSLRLSIPLHVSTG
jgi:hypothetical protein